MYRKTTMMRSVEARYNEPIEMLLRKWYVDEGVTQQRIAQRLGVRTSTVCKWMRRLKIRFPDTEG